MLTGATCHSATWDSFGSRAAIRMAEFPVGSRAESTAVTRPRHCRSFPFFSVQEAVRGTLTLPCSSLGRAENSSSGTGMRIIRS